MRKKTEYFHAIPLFTLLLVLVSSCNSGKEEPKNEVIFNKEVSSENTAELKKEKKKEPRLLITYHLDSLANSAEVDSFQTRFSAEQQKFIFALNRVDPRRLNAGDQLIIPDTLTENFLDYAPFPEELDLLDSIPKTVLISRRIQAFAIYEAGKLKKWGPVSSGKESTQTPAGLNYGNYKAKNKVSTVNKDWLMPYYFNFMNFEGVGTHQYSMPGYPASHACVRLRKDDAVFIYEWAEQWKLDESGEKVLRNGTPFMVFGDYDFEAAVPWLKLAKDPKSNFLNKQEMETLKKYVTEYKKDERNFTKEKPEGDALPPPPGEGLETVS